ncbi:MAG: hypothetical protein M1838_005425 [Thelocarpon superellum]|nr:MAG: hypothetical protein M1838_005425 [Thelocarpon superellum]
MADYASGSLWFYAPNKGAPVAFAVLFAISGAVHAVQNTRYHCWVVSGFLPVAALCFVAGFILREIGAFDFSNLNIYIASQVLLYVGPPFYETANYLLIGRVLYYVPYMSPAHPAIIQTSFLLVDVAIAALTSNGASRLANYKEPWPSQNAGLIEVKVALVLQVVCMVSFIAVTARYHYNCHRGGVLIDALRPCLITLYASCTLITIRTIYRVAEIFGFGALTAATSLSPLVTHEWFFWVFEASLMLSNSLLQNIFFPRRYLPRSFKTYLARDGVTELDGPGYKDLKPREIWALFRGRKTMNYWEQEESAHEVAPVTNV